MKKVILYLRTDICDEELTAGGSVAHSIGVIKGFLEHGYSVACASSCLDSVLQGLPLVALVKLANPSWLNFLRWKGNSFLSSFFFFIQARKLLQQHQITALYQRYSMLNMTGVLLSWWYKKPLILEYNGSEVWVTTHWAKKRRFITGAWLLALVEKINIRCADYLIVVSEVLRDEVIQYGAAAEKVLVNPNGVDAEMFYPMDTPKVHKQPIFSKIWDKYNCHPQRSEAKSEDLACTSKHFLDSSEGDYCSKKNYCFLGVIPSDMNEPQAIEQGAGRLRVTNHFCSCADPTIVDSNLRELCKVKVGEQHRAYIKREYDE